MRKYKNSAFDLPEEFYVLDMEIGLAMASEYDPMTKDTVSVSGIFYQYMVLLFLIVSNLHQYLVKDHRYDYIETGSLISVRSRSRDINDTLSMASNEAIS